MNCQRMVHIDFHNMPGIADFGKAFDAQKIAQSLKEAHAERVNLFAQCNLGFAYYPTKVGTVYPNLKCDCFGELAAACKAQGIEVVAYINAGVNHELARKRYDCCRVNKEGKILTEERTGNFFRTMCFHSKAYREHVSALVKEIAAYDIDGMFFDSIYPEPCYCNQCTEEMLRRGIDITKEEQVREFAFEQACEFCKLLKSLLPEHFSFYANGMPFDVLSGTDTHAEIECLPGTWGYDYFLPMAAYARKLTENVVYMTGRFQKDWGDFGGYKTKASLENDAFDALSNACGFCIGDHMHPSGELDESLYREIGELYRRMELYEPWTKGCRYLAEIAVLRNRASSRRSILDGNLQGAARMLSELKYDFDFIHEDMDFSCYKLLILADSFEMTEKAEKKLQAYLQNGGAVLGSGTSCVDERSGRFVPEEMQFLSYCGKEPQADDELSGYYQTEESKRAIASYSSGILMKTDDEDTLLAKRVSPYFTKHWDGLHGYFYTPPKEASEYAAAVCKGKVAYISFPVFCAYFKYAYHEHRELVGNLLRRLLPHPQILAEELPKSARVTLTGEEDYRLLHVKVTKPEPRGWGTGIDEHDILPEGRHVLLKGCWTQAKRLPDGLALPLRQTGEYTELCLPQICGYDMFLIQP